MIDDLSPYYVLGFGQLIRDLRRQTGASQADIAAAGGLRQATWSAIEIGRSRPTPETLHAMGLAFQHYGHPLTGDWLMEAQRQIDAGQQTPDLLTLHLVERLQAYPMEVRLRVHALISSVLDILDSQDQSGP